MVSKAVKAKSIARAMEVKERNSRKDIDVVLLEKLASTMLSTESIANILEVSSQTLERNYEPLLHKARDNRRRSLVEKMWSKALDGGDTTMLIWLSKQHLGYREPKVDEVTGATTFNITVRELPKLPEPTVIEIKQDERGE